jgi:hypothetical protein
VATDAEALQWMQRADFDPAREVVLIGGQGAELAPDRPVALSPCYLVTYAPELITINADLPQDGYLVLTDAYYPGWTATIDGQPAAIERADLMFRAVKVPAGSHRVELRYQPQSFSIGLLISIGTVMVLCGVWLAARRRNRSRVL